jgi:hypothetical protein
VRFIVAPADGGCCKTRTTVLAEGPITASSGDLRALQSRASPGSEAAERERRGADRQRAFSCQRSRRIRQVVVGCCALLGVIFGTVGAAHKTVMTYPQCGKAGGRYAVSDSTVLQLILLAVAVYFIPNWIASARGHHNVNAISSRICCWAGRFSGGSSRLSGP